MIYHYEGNGMLRTSLDFLKVTEGDEAADSVGPGVFLDWFDSDEGDKVFFYRANRYAIYL